MNSVIERMHDFYGNIFRDRSFFIGGGMGEKIGGLEILMSLQKERGVLK